MKSINQNTKSEHRFADIKLITWIKSEQIIFIHFRTLGQYLNWTVTKYYKTNTLPEGEKDLCPLHISLPHCEECISLPPNKFVRDTLTL